MDCADFLDQGCLIGGYFEEGQVGVRSQWLLLHFLSINSNFPIAQYIWCVRFEFLLKSIEIALIVIRWVEGKLADHRIVEKCHFVILLLYAVVVAEIGGGAGVDYARFELIFNQLFSLSLDLYIFLNGDVVHYFCEFALLIPKSVQCHQ